MYSIREVYYFVFYLFGNNSMAYSFEYCVCVCVICRIKMRFLLAFISQNGQY